MTDPLGAEDATAAQRPGTVLDLPLDPGARHPDAAMPRDVIGSTCPYLTSATGSFRMAGPSRDHRCAAVDPPAPQPSDKQRRHCLSADHVECPMFRAARSARVTTLAGGADPALVEAADHRRRPLARTAPILLEPPRLVDSAVRAQLERAPGQIVLIGLMVVAFAIVALTRLSSAGSAPPGSSAPSIVVASPTPRSSPTATPSPTGSVAPSTPSSAVPTASFRTTYKVKKGDTLLSIARAFSTTAAKIKQLNGLTSSTLKVGQTLKIP